jgi:hypothetical protein
VVVRVDLTAAGRPISPLIYGVAFASPQVLRELGASLNRFGGNPTSRYNWVNGRAWNAARDWEFRNNNGDRPPGSIADQFVADTVATGVRPLLTVPMLGWVARNDDNGTRSVNVPNQGGPPIKPGSDAIAGYDPAGNRQATSLPSLAHKPGPLLDPPDPAAPAVYQDEWVHHLMDRFGAAVVPYFAMDNEPDLWSITHTDVHPVRMGYDDMLRTFLTYASAVKAVDPRAQVLGPDVSGWTAYWYAELDRGADNFATHADRRAHGDSPFLPWWLGQVAAHDRASGTRLLDYLDVHYYPQASGLSDTSSQAVQALRIRSVRSLWDPHYADESWIGEPVMLIPRLKRWIADTYPGTKLAITEYNWGGERDASGAVALAEVLGIFGREGVDLASYWAYPPPDSPAGAAFRLYRNYDGRGSTFGDLSLPATSTQAAVAVYAARHSDGAETDLIVVNQSADQTATIRLDLGGRTPAHLDAFILRGGSAQIEPWPVSPTAAMQLPPLSISLVRLVGAG